MSVATFRSGSPLMVDHTPSSAVAEGAVVVVNDTVRIGHRPIPANTLGALAAGGGVYTLPKSTAASSAIPAGRVVFWDATNAVITTNAASGANKRIGTTVSASVDADATQDVIHQVA